MFQYYFPTKKILRIARLLAVSASIFASIPSMTHAETSNLSYLFIEQSAGEAANIITCFSYAGSPHSKYKPNNTSGVAFEKINIEYGKKHCQDALLSPYLPDFLKSDTEVALGRALYAGEEYKLAFEYFDNASKSGNFVAINALGVHYYYGKGVSRDWVKARQFFEQTFGKVGGNSEYLTATLYDNGRGVKADKSRAFSLFKSSADQGNVFGQLQTGYNYFYGTGAEKDVDVAFTYFLKAAKQENIDASVFVAYYYDVGEGALEPDLKEAVKWYNKAADAGHAHAQYNLANLYYQGRGVTRDLQKALHLYKLAAAQDHAKAKQSFQKLEREILIAKIESEKRRLEEEIEKDKKKLGICNAPEIGTTIWAVFGKGSSARVRQGYIAQIAREKVKVDWEYCDTCTKAPWVNTCSIYINKIEAENRVRELDRGHISGEEALGAAAIVGGALLLQCLFGQDGC